MLSFVTSTFLTISILFGMGKFYRSIKAEPNEQKSDSLLPLLYRLYEQANRNITISSERYSYHLGDNVSFQIHVTKSGYLYLISTEPLGNTVLLFPNRFNENNYITENSTIYIPRDVGGFEIKAIEPPGTSTIFAILSDTALTVFDTTTTYTHGPFKKLEFSQIEKLTKTNKKDITVLPEASSSESKSGLSMDKIVIEVEKP